MSKYKIKKIDNENKEIKIFNTIKEASASVNTKMDNWKIQMFIVNSINTGKRAFKCNWKKI